MSEMFSKVIVAVVVLCHALTLPLMCKALQWNVNRTTEIIFGQTEMELICSGSGCCNGSRGWSKEPGSKVLMTDGTPSDPTKYKETRETNSFSLIFKSLELTDVNTKYTCSLDFDSSTSDLLLPTADVFRYIPNGNRDIEIVKNFTGSIIYLTANITTVFPEPICLAGYEDNNLTSSMVLTTYENFPVNYTVIEMNAIPYKCNNGPGTLVISCKVGSTKFIVFEEQLCVIEKTNCNLYLVAILLILIGVFILIFILWKKGIIIILDRPKVIVRRYNNLVIIICCIRCTCAVWTKSSLDGSTTQKIKGCCTCSCTCKCHILIIWNIEKEDEGVYSCVPGKTLALWVDGVAASVSKQYTSYTITTGDNIQLTFQESQTEGLKWQWTRYIPKPNETDNKGSNDHSKATKKYINIDKVSDNEELVCFRNVIKRSQNKACLFLKNVTTTDGGVYSVVSLGKKTSVLGSIVLNVVDDIIRLGEESKVVTRQPGDIIEIQCHLNPHTENLSWTKMSFENSSVSSVTQNHEQVIKATNQSFPFMVIENIKGEDMGFYQHCKIPKDKCGILMLRIKEVSIDLYQASVCHTVFEDETCVMMFPSNLDLCRKQVKGSHEDSVSLSQSNDFENRSYAIKSIRKADEGIYELSNVDEESNNTGRILLNLVDDIILVEKDYASHVIQKGSSVSLLPLVMEHVSSSGVSFTWEHGATNSHDNQRLPVDHGLGQIVTSQLILKNVTKANEGSYVGDRKDSNGSTDNRVLCTITIVDAFLTVGNQPLVHTAQVGESLAIKYIESVPSWSSPSWTKVQDGSRSQFQLKPVSYRNAKNALFIKRITKEDEGVYHFRAVNKKDALIIKSAAVTITVEDTFLAVGNQPLVHTSQVGESLAIKCIESVPRLSSPSWTKVRDGSRSQFQLKPVSYKNTKNALFIKRITKDDEGVYHFEAVDKKGSLIMKSSSVTITVQDTFLAVGNQPLLHTAQVGESLAIKYIESSLNLSSPTWKKVPVGKGARNQLRPVSYRGAKNALVISGITKAEEGIYHFEAVNKIDQLTITSASVTITVQDREEVQQSEMKRKDEITGKSKSDSSSTVPMFPPVGRSTNVSYQGSTDLDKSNQNMHLASANEVNLQNIRESKNEEDERDDTRNSGPNNDEHTRGKSKKKKRNTSSKKGKKKTSSIVSDGNNTVEEVGSL